MGTWLADTLTHLESYVGHPSFGRSEVGNWLSADQILATGDGCYYFGNPAAAHSTAASQNLPFITIIFNNAKWATVANHTNRWYSELEEPTPPLTDLGPPANFDQLVAAFGGYGERVTKAAELPAALERAINEVRKGRQALINVICDSGITKGEVA